MPTLDELTTYAHNDRYGYSCRVAHLTWAIRLAMDAEDWDYVDAACQLRRNLCS